MVPFEMFLLGPVRRITRRPERVTQITEDNLVNFHRAALSILLALAGASIASAQNAAPAATSSQVVIGGHNFIHAVADVQKSSQFYRDAFGLELEREIRPAAAVPVLQQLANTPGAKFRATSVKLPGANFSLEFTEFSDIERKVGQSNMQDPGSSMLALIVRDVDATLAKAVKAGAKIVTTGGKILRQGAPDAPNYNRAIFLRDLDGFLIEMLQLYPQPPSKAPADSAVLGGGIGITVSDVERTAAFWRQFGLEVKVGEAAPGNATTMALSATQNATFRIGNARIPGTDFQLLLAEFTGIARKPYQGRLQDPGTPAVSLAVRDLDAAMQAVKAAGARVVTTGGAPVHMGPTGGNVFIRDPDGFLVELIQEATRP